jgi:hypothetical protein
MPFLSTFYPQIPVYIVYKLRARLACVDNFRLIHKLLETYPQRPNTF